MRGAEIKCERCKSFLQFVEPILESGDLKVNRYFCNRCHHFVEVIERRILAIPPEQAVRYSASLYFWKRPTAPIEWRIRFALQEFGGMCLCLSLLPIVIIITLIETVAEKGKHPFLPD